MMPERADDPPSDSLDDLYAEPWESDEVLTERDIERARRIAPVLFGEDAADE